MGIEDIPEMQVVERKDLGDRYGIVVIEPKRLDDFYGKFICLRDQSGRNYVYGCSFENFFGLKHSDLDFRFGVVAMDKYHCEERFSTIGGGTLKIDESEVIFCDTSTDFGKYAEQLVRPIAERWKQQNLPKHELVFK